MPAFAGQTNGDAQSECARLRAALRRHRLAAQRPLSQGRRDEPAARRPARACARAGRSRSSSATGVIIFPMPDLRFESLRNASLDLNRLKLQLDKTTYAVNDDVPRDHVVSQDPPPLSSVRARHRRSASRSAKARRPACACPTSTGMSIDDGAPSRASARASTWARSCGRRSAPAARGAATVVRQSPGPGAHDRPVRGSLAASQRRTRRVRLPDPPGARRRRRFRRATTRRACASRCATTPAPGTSTTASRRAGRSWTSTSPRSARPSSTRTSTTSCSTRPRSASSRTRTDPTSPPDTKRPKKK